MALTEKELKHLVSLMPQTSSIMASAVAKLMLASPNPRANRSDPSTIFASFPHLSSNDWSNTGVCGALVLVVDRAKDSVLFQIYDLEGMLKRFEYEVYYDMEYQSLDPSFHAFEMEECIAGFSFSSRDIARKFLAKVRALTPTTLDRISTLTPGSSEAKKKGLFASKQKPVQISGVVNVVHKQHVGVMNDGALDLNTVSPEWRQLFKQAGVKKRDLRNPETSRALIQSIQQSGYSLAVAPGTYVQASPLKPKEGLLAEKKTKNNMQQPQYQPKVYTAQELKKHYTKDQVDMYVAYQEQLAAYEKAQKKYFEDLAEYEKQVALQKWEKDNKAFLEEQDRMKRVSKDPKFTTPPPLPPRKNKNGAPTDSDNRPRFETAPINSKPSYSIPPIVTHSLPTQPMRKPQPSPIASSSPARNIPEHDMYGSSNSNNNDYNNNSYYPQRPMSPELPPAPALPKLQNGDNPVMSLQDQLQSQAGRLRAADRPPSKMMLRAVAGSQLDLRQAVNPLKKTDVTTTEDLLGTLVNALAVRRAQLGEDDKDDSDDDWSS